MKFSESWLRELVDPGFNAEELVSQLTMAGLEVDGTEPVAAQFSGVVVAEILATEPHENADKLVVCRVRDGQGEHQVVCGAPNARAGIKIPFATVGAMLEDFKIKKAKLRGVESFGMLCSERELGLSDSHEGLMELPADAPVGDDVRQYLGLDDLIIDLDLTPNRSDCLGMVGLARETGLISKHDVAYPESRIVPASIEDTFPVTLDCPEACPRFVGRVVRGIKSGVKSPLWLTEKLRRSGLRSIDPIVDVTNYIMLELNHPMHAYDLARLSGGISVRMSNASESIDLLDGSSIELQPDTVLITDGSGPVGLGGIMGGLGTSVTSETTDLFLECAFFTPEAIAGVARSYGMNTDASHRFERGVDWQGQVRAIERATELLIDIVGGQAGPIVDTVDERHLPQIREVMLRSSRVTQLLGVAIPDADIEDMLTRLEFPFETTDTGWKVTSPSHRFDIEIEADLIEEICRVYGYNTIKAQVPVASLSMAARSEGILPLDQVRDRIVARGYQEAITYGFVDSGVQGLLDPENEPLGLQNPLSSEMSVMRTTLWPGLLKSLVYNLNRQQDRVRLFEVGLRFRQTPNQPELAMSNIRQEKVLSGVVTGSRYPESWNEGNGEIDFYDVKGDVESVLSLSGRDRFRFVQATHPALHPGQTAEIYLGETLVGSLGLLAPGTQRQLDIRQPVYVFELLLEPLLSRSVATMTAVSRFPEVRRDLALVVDDSVLADSVVDIISAKGGHWLRDVNVFDVYSGPGIEPGKKSLAIALNFQHPEKTLLDDEINKAVSRVVDELAQTLGATQR